MKFLHRLLWERLEWYLNVIIFWIPILQNLSNYKHKVILSVAPKTFVLWNGHLENLCQAVNFHNVANLHFLVISFWSLKRSGIFCEFIVLEFDSNSGDLQTEVKLFCICLKEKTPYSLYVVSFMAVMFYGLILQGVSLKSTKINCSGNMTHTTEANLFLMWTMVFGELENITLPKHLSFEINLSLYVLKPSYCSMLKTLHVQSLIALIWYCFWIQNCMHLDKTKLVSNWSFFG